MKNIKGSRKTLYSLYWRPKQKIKEIFMKWLEIFSCKRSRGR